MTSLDNARRSTLRRTVISILVTSVLVVGSVAIAATVSDAVRSRLGVTGSSNAPTAQGIDARKKLVLSAKVLKGPLVPGVKRPLKVTIKNPLNQAVVVTSVAVKVGKPKAPGCKPGWVKTTSFKATKKKKPIKVRARGRAAVTLSITLKNLTSTNQDACKSTSFPLKLRANAKQT